MSIEKVNKEVKYILPANDINMDDLKLKQALPMNNITQVDPFLLLHHADFKFREHGRARHEGVAPHPHRGFSPVTFIINGELQHRDSRGNNQIAKKGDVQWLSAGAGIMHSERPTQDLIDNNENQEIIQLWINTPEARKLNQPYYQYMEESTIPVFYSDDKAIKNKLVAGSYGDLYSDAIIESPLLILWSVAEAQGTQVLKTPKEYNTMLYLIKGKMRIDGFGLVDPQNLIVFENNAEDIAMSLEPETEFILFSGVPLDEEIARRGPFVMNNETELLEAMRDYRMGKMGMLIEDF